MKLLTAVVIAICLGGCRHSTPLAGGDSAGPAGAPPAPAPSTAATRGDFENLSRLTFQVTGGFAGLNDTLDITPGRAELTRTRPPSKRESVFSRAEWTALVEMLEKADFARLVGNYRQENLADGWNETLTVTVGVGQKQRTYVVTNYGDKAPAAYYQLTAHLRDLQEHGLTSVR